MQPDRMGHGRGVSRSELSRWSIGLLLLGALAEFALLAAWQRNGYWDFSDGVYAQSAREFLHGLVPYRDFAAAQPPGVYLVGAVLLFFHDGLGSLRAGLAVVDLLTAVLVGVCVWRLTGRRGIALAAAALAPLLPISLHEHAQLTPETLAAPLLLGGAIWAARSRAALPAALLPALAVATKLAFVIPALAVALASPARRRTTGWLVAILAVLALASLAAFGTNVWRQAVEAQWQVGRASLHYAGGLLAQGAWSELVLVVGAAAALLSARNARDPQLMRTIAAAAGAGLVLIFTVFKRGSYVNVLQVADPPLLVLAACGLSWSWPRWARGRPILAALCVLLALQSISILVSPANPWAARRPGARSGLAWSAGPAAVDAEVAALRRCPATAAVSADPYYAFLAGRRMPGSQPDLFMLENARIDAGFAARAARDRPRCAGG